MFIFASVFCAVTVSTLTVQYLSYRQYIQNNYSTRTVQLQAEEELCSC